MEIGVEAAFAQAKKSLSEGGIPVGACLMIDNTVIAVGHNRRVQKGSNILHGETDCIEAAGHAFDLRQATLFTTLSPCKMCAGAILLYGIPKVIILDNINTGDFETSEAMLRDAGVDVVIHIDDRIVEMKRAFQTNPETRRLWVGDVGLD
ncbi:MAG: nucleoside deaminase [Pseudomonadota bacterium]